MYLCFDYYYKIIIKQWTFSSQKRDRDKFESKTSLKWDVLFTWYPVLKSKASQSSFSTRNNCLPQFLIFFSSSWRNFPQFWNSPRLRCRVNPINLCQLASFLWLKRRWGSWLHIYECFCTTDLLNGSSRWSGPLVVHHFIKLILNKNLLES